MESHMKALPTNILKMKGFWEKVINFPVTYDEQTSTALVEYPGLMYDDFDIHSGHPTIRSLMKLFHSCYICAFEKGLDDSGRTFRDTLDLFQFNGRLHFLVSLELEITKDMYDPSVGKRSLEVHCSLGHVGNTSLSRINRLRTKDGRVLTQEIVQSVAADPITRRPAPIPDWWKNKYSKYANLKSPGKIVKEGRPESDFHYETKIGFSETDANGHTNSATYPQKAVDAAHYFSRTGKLKYFDTNLRNGIKNVKILYMGESGEGDTITIYVWERESNWRQMFAHICKNDDLLCQITFEYFDSKAGL